jgi:hypothetical protein
MSRGDTTASTDTAWRDDHDGDETVDGPTDLPLTTGGGDDPTMVMKFAFPALRWDMIDILRDAIASLVTRLLGSRDRAERVAMAAHELMENASKYSLDRHVLVGCRVYMCGQTVIVTVRNNADPAQVSVLREELSFVNEGDPFERYVERMQASLEREGSMLGLARIRSEGGAKLAAETNGTSVLVSAVFEAE